MRLCGRIVLFLFISALSVLFLLSAFLQSQSSTAMRPLTWLSTHLLGWSAVTVVDAAPQATATDATATGTTPTSASVFTVPASATVGAPVIANVEDPQAVDAQSVCPGYTASDAVTTDVGLTAQLSLAGPPCNVYGNDIDRLSLTVEYQARDRLHVKITPTYIDASNASYFAISENLVRKPTIDPDAPPPEASDLEFSWSNDPTFSFTVTRRSNGDVLFSTMGRKLVFEDQFIEFGSDLPEDYNVYGLGEVIHGLRLGNNLTRTLWAADVGDPVDE